MNSLLRGLMASDGNTNRPFPSLILLGIVDFCCILIGLEQVSVQKIASGIIWIFAGMGSGLIGFYWTQVKQTIAKVRVWFRKEPSKIPTLRLKVLEMCSELQGFIATHGHEPEKPHRELPETNEDFLHRYRQWQQDKITWGTKFAGDFRLLLLDRISHLRDEILAKAHIDDFDLSTSIETAANDSTGNDLPPEK